MVTADARYRLKFLRLTRVDAKAYVPADRMIAAFESDLEGMAFTRSRRLAPGEKAAAGTVLVFTVEELQPSSFYNGCTYVDTMSREAIQEFIRRTHEQYAAHCGERLGSSIRGIFTDEPHRGAVMSGFSVPNPDPVWLTPYTPALFTEFRAAFGYDLTDHLPELFLHKDGEKLSPVKWQYMELLQRLQIIAHKQPQLSAAAAKLVPGAQYAADRPPAARGQPDRTGGDGRLADAVLRVYGSAGYRHPR